VLWRSILEWSTWQVPVGQKRKGAEISAP